MSAPDAADSRFSRNAGPAPEIAVEFAYEPTDEALAETVAIMDDETRGVRSGEAA